MTRENPNFMHRDAHPKQHGLVRARFSVEPQLPEHLVHGAFQPGASYDAWVRFSNQNAPPQNDYSKDIRGAAIKLLNVPGEKIQMPDGNATSQDFITVSTPVFVASSVEQFFKLIDALLKGKLHFLWFMLRHPCQAIKLIKANRRFFSPLEARYWSTTPYRLGAKQIVKYSLIPHAEPTPLQGDTSPNFLREHMADQLSAKAYLFDFCVQLQKNPATMPVEDPSVLWREEESPFIKVATLTIAQQSFDSPAQNDYGLSLSFNPWHCLPAHEPLGGINRARKLIYNHLSQFRHERNHQARFEPTDLSVPPVIS